MENNALENSMYHNKVYIVNKCMCPVEQIVMHIKDYEHKGINKQVLLHSTIELKCVFLIIMLTCYKEEK